MGDGVVTGDAGAVVGGDAVPVGVGAGDARVVVDRDHLAAGAVPGVVAEGVLEEPVGLARTQDLVLLVLVERAREGVALGVDLVGGGVGLLVELTVGGVGHHRPAVERLAGGGVEDQRLADRRLVPHLDRPGQGGRAVDAAGRPGAVDDQLGVADLEALREGGGEAVLVTGRLGLDRLERAGRRVLARQRRRHVEVDVGGDEAVDRGEVTVAVDVGLELTGEDRHALVGLGEGDRPAGGTGVDLGLLQLRGAGAEGRRELGEVGGGLLDGALAALGGDAGEQVGVRALGAGEADASGGGVGSQVHGPGGGVAQSAHVRLLRLVGRRCLRTDHRLDRKSSGDESEAEGESLASIELLQRCDLSLAPGIPFPSDLGHPRDTGSFQEGPPRGFTRQITSATARPAARGHER